MKLTTSDEDIGNLINNRQNGRRRGRGSGAPRPNGSGGGPDRGNRLDNRARGNASQLHEKYKTLARDAQMQGDRVMTEYYLQFADHYFRILSESRARFDEQRRPQGQGDYEDGDGDGGQGADDRDDVDGFDQQPRYEQPRRDYRPEQQRDPQRSQPRNDARPAPRDDESDNREIREPRDVRDGGEPRERDAYADRAPRGRPRRDSGNGIANGAREPAAEPEPRLEMDRLPPALSVNLASEDEAVAEEPPRPRRGRRPRAESTPAPDAG